MTSPAPTVTVARQRCDERRTSLNRLIEKYGNPTPNAAQPRKEQPVKAG